MKNILKIGGQTAVSVIVMTSLITGAVSWILNNVLSSPAHAETEITNVNTKLEKLCTDYGLTVSRIDDNTQAIGRALKINVTSGHAGSNPCKD